MDIDLKTHRHYFDYGYSEWQCIGCDSSADECTFSRSSIDTEAGCSKAGRWSMGLPGKHPEYLKAWRPRDIGFGDR
jgi:hypothetical protein